MVAYGDSEFLAQRDKTVHDFRDSDKDTKRKIIGKMLTLRHNMKYNKHLLSVYMKAKGLFDTMIEEHRAQLHYLDEIYRHLNHLIRENLSSQQKNKNVGNNAMMTELVKDKKRIGSLLKKMRGSFNKLMDIDTVIGVTIAQINEITFMEDHDDNDREGEGEDDADEDEDDESEDGESEADESEDDESEDGEDDEAEAGEDDESAEADEDDEADEADEDDEAEADEDDEAEADEAEADEAEADSEAEDDDSEYDDSEAEAEEPNSIYLF